MRNSTHFSTPVVDLMTKRNHSRGHLKSLGHEIHAPTSSLNNTGSVTVHSYLLDESENSTLLSLKLKQKIHKDSTISLVTFLPESSDDAGDRGMTSLSTISSASSLSTTSTARPASDLGTPEDSSGARIVFELATPPTNNGAPGPEEALLNRSSVLFVAVSFILLMVISLAWLVFYYVQRFRYLHSKERVSRRLAELAKKAVARIPIKTLHAGDRETNSDLDQCAICIEPFRPLDNIRVLPCRHYFHKLCIDPWLLEQRSCPMCKLDILQAYGLRSEFFFGYPNAESIPTGSSRPSDVLLAASAIGMTSGSRSGSDDGMERIALVHSHSRSTLTRAQTNSALNYMVLSGTGPANALANDSVAAAATSSPRYYTRGSDSSDSAAAAVDADGTMTTVPQPTLQDLPNTAIPLQASAHNIIVSLLPRLSSQPPPAAMATSTSLEQTPSDNLSVAWSPERGSDIAPSTTQVTDCNSPSQSSNTQPQHCSVQSECWVYSIPQQSSQSSGVLAPTTDASVFTFQKPGVTSTTQILVAPLCSVRTDGTFLDDYRSLEVDCQSDSNDTIAPVPVGSANWRVASISGNNAPYSTASGVGSANAPADATVPCPVPVNEGKHSLLHPGRTKPARRQRNQTASAERLWHILTRPFCSSRTRSTVLSVEPPEGRSPNIPLSFADLAPSSVNSVSRSGIKITAQQTAHPEGSVACCPTEQVIVAQVESTQQISQPGTSIPSVIPAGNLDLRHSGIQSNPG